MRDADGLDLAATRDADLALLADAARQAGALALRHFAGDPQVWHKAGGSPVSEADLEIDRLLHAILTTARPDYGWLSEETADNPDRLGSRRLFVIDPIDGTRAFLAKSPLWAVSIAVVEDGRPVAAALFEPVIGHLMLARAGGGARIGSTPLVASDAPTIHNARLGATRGLLAHPAVAAGGLVAMPHVPSLALRMARVAENALDIAFASANAHDWDLAAADLLVHEAGGRLVTRDGSAICYNEPVPRHPALVASGQVLLGPALELLRQVTPA